MNFILKAKHWQVFLILLLGLFLNNTLAEGNQTLTMVFAITGLLIILIWPLLIGHALYDFLPKRVDLNYNLFLINGFISLLVISVITIFSVGQRMTFTGLAALPMFYVFYAFLHLYGFPAKELKSIEKGDEASIGEYIGYFFLIVFLPIGIWILQPKINKIVNEREKLINE